MIENRLYWPVAGITKPVCWQHIAHLVLAHLFTYTGLSTELGNQGTTPENWLFGAGLDSRVHLISVGRALNWLFTLKYVKYCYINGLVHPFECSGLPVAVIIWISGRKMSPFNIWNLTSGSSTAWPSCIIHRSSCINYSHAFHAAWCDLPWWFWGSLGP